GNCRPLEVGDLKFAFASASHDVVIRCQKLREAKLVCALDIGNQQSARAVFLRYINRDAKIDVCLPQSDRVPIENVEAVIELGKLIECAQQGPGDQMCIGSFAATVFVEIL